MLSPLTKRLVALALEEDLGPGDLTSNATADDTESSAEIVAKSELVLAGLEALEETFRQLDPRVKVKRICDDGTHVAPQTVVAKLDGPARSLLSGERVALNFIQRLSGIATLTRRCVVTIAHTNAKLVDTRKTTPGLRELEKQAVALGGARNHRFGLFDGILVKDNHIAAAGGVKPAIAKARAAAHHLLKIEVEVQTFLELDEALDAGADVILLDNMSDEGMRRAVEKTKKRAILEASGSMSLERLPSVAATGVDLISMGALTHSAPAADLSMRWIRRR
ncbi:MAG: carboxylating nicotinate-nucleotide diphosphorylase [Deltaproteobacteria bacterium]|nr:carboxylating nicotinate-nucleotide diphosphorylase [Deltaproteobacteria bacterium]